MFLSHFSHFALMLLAFLSHFSLISLVFHSATTKLDAGWKKVTLKRGDTLAKLALLNNLDVATIKRANNIVGPEVRSSPSLSLTFRPHFSRSFLNSPSVFLGFRPVSLVLPRSSALSHAILTQFRHAKHDQIEAWCVLKSILRPILDLFSASKWTSSEQEG